MESALRAAIRSGLSEAEFWPLTPYRLGLIVQERARAVAQDALWPAWMNARLAVEREPSLSGPQHYHRMFFDAEASAQDAEALADAEFNRIARLFGTEIVELEPDALDG